MFDLAGNVTLLPDPIPRRSVMALWQWPSHDSPSGGDSISQFHIPMPIGEGLSRVCGLQAVACRHVPLVEMIDLLVSTGLSDTGTSRSARAWGHVIRCALGAIARHGVSPTITPGGVDVWTPTNLGQAENRLIQDLTRWIPPEAHCNPVEGDSGAMTTASAAIGAMYGAVADLLPRSPAAAAEAGHPAWATIGTSDVSAMADQMRHEQVSRRSSIQLRLDLPDPESGSPAVQLFFKSPTDGSPAVATSDLWSSQIPLDTQAEHDLLFLLRRASLVWAPLERMLDQACPSRIVLSSVEADDLLSRGGRDLLAAGFEVLVPAGLERTVTSKPSIEVVSNPSGHRSTRFTVESLCEISWKIELDNRVLSDDEIRRLLEADRKLVHLDDGWIILDERVLANIGRRLRTSGAGALAAALSSGSWSSGSGSSGEEGDWDSVADPETGVRVDPMLSRFIDGLLEASQDHDRPQPSGLHGSLRPYQRSGVAWLSCLLDAGFGGILADDMGLGKTIQLIATYLHHRERLDEPVLVVAPAGLLHNWNEEFRRWAPQIRVSQFHGPERSLADARDEEVVITTYGIVRRSISELGDTRWGLVVADEAQHLKNHRSATARNMARLDTGVRVAMTGTPVENHLGDLWSLLNWTTPGLLGPLETFRRESMLPIERDGDDDARAGLARKVAPFVLRRTKTDPEVITDLPPRTITDHVTRLTVEQAVLYRATTSRILESVRSASGMERRGAILKLLTALKQITNHPAHYLGQPGGLLGRSGKFDFFCELTTEILMEQHSAVVFTQYVKMAELLVSGLHDLGHGAELLKGSMPLNARTRLLDQFAERRFPLLVVSLRAGGVGLNLTTASHVIHYDRWWNPAVENQASDRVWRIGQTSPVQVHRLITEGTIESRIAALLEAKQTLADSVIDSERAMLTELTDEDLTAFVTLDESIPSLETELQEPGE